MGPQFRLMAQRGQVLSSPLADKVIAVAAFAGTLIPQVDRALATAR